MRSASVNVSPIDSRCSYWAKVVRAGAALPLPQAADRASDIPGGFLRGDYEELAPGDFLIEGEQNHHRKNRGWTYRIAYLGIDGEVHRVTPTREMKAAMKQAGVPVQLLQGSGLLAGCVRLIEALRLHVDLDLVPLDAPGGKFNAEEYEAVWKQRAFWFAPTRAGDEPTYREVMEHAWALLQLKAATDEASKVPMLELDELVDAA